MTSLQIQNEASDNNSLGFQMFSIFQAQNSVCKRLHSHSDSSLRGQQDKTR